MTKQNHNKKIYMAITIVALGVVMAANLPESMRPIGLVFVGIGGLFLILGLRDKKNDASNNPDQG